ncbi:MAG: glycosyltransferase [Zavarzinella sp.]
MLTGNSLGNLLKKTHHRTTGVVGINFVIDELNRAGTESQLLALINGLDRRKFLPTLTILRDTVSPLEQELAADVPTIHLGVQHLIGLRSLPAASRLLSFWRQHKVQILQTYFLDSCYFSVPLAKLAGIRHIIRVRNNTGYWLTPRQQWLGKGLEKLCRLTLTNSPQAREQLIERENVPAWKVRVIANGVDMERFSGLPVPKFGPTVHVGMVANLRDVKNVESFIRVAAKLCSTRRSVKFSVAGEGPLRPHLEAEIARLNLGGSFQLLGKCEDIPHYLGGLDVAVLCSTSESMSNAVLEYMAAARGIVVTDVGNNSQLIRHNVDGHVIPANVDGALQKSLETLIDNPETTRKMGRNARTRVEEQYARKVMLREFEELYAGLAENW